MKRYPIFVLGMLVGAGSLALGCTSGDTGDSTGVPPFSKGGPPIQTFFGYHYDEPFEQAIVVWKDILLKWMTDNGFKEDEKVFQNVKDAKYSLAPDPKDARSNGKTAYYVDNLWLWFLTAFRAKFGYDYPTDPFDIPDGTSTVSSPDYVGSPLPRIPLTYAEDGLIAYRDALVSWMGEHRKTFDPNQNGFTGDMLFTSAENLSVKRAFTGVHEPEPVEGAAPPSTGPLDSQDELSITKAFRAAYKAMRARSKG
jgi:hypothetical protein